ncbi:hypothetical protein SDC9_177304 [bioreactor metagenome]|uniref:Uncharacterized protein n=1 Tax=bioreactor metagenome TaxID=1076179 RepID=A0A645GSM1_9ZZZZ
MLKQIVLRFVLANGRIGERIGARRVDGKSEYTLRNVQIVSGLRHLGGGLSGVGVQRRVHIHNGWDDVRRCAKGVKLLHGLALPHRANHALVSKLVRTDRVLGGVRNDDLRVQRGDLRFEVFDYVRLVELLRGHGVGVVIAAGITAKDRVFEVPFRS